MAGSRPERASGLCWMYSLSYGANDDDDESMDEDMTPVPQTFKIEIVDITLCDDEKGRSFSVHVHVRVRYVSCKVAVLGIRYEMDWKPVVIGILKSNFRW